MNYLKIDKCDYLNGRGVGVVLWLSGCNHHCEGCQNQKSWNSNNGQPFDKKAEDELIEHLKLPYISRLTLSGGDPLHENNIEGVLNLVNKILHCQKKTIWLYTGYTFEQCVENTTRRQIISKCDVLVDGRYVDSQRDITLKWRGSSNQRVIDIKQSLLKGKIVLHER